MTKLARQEDVCASSAAGYTVDISAADHTFPATDKIVGLYVGGSGDVVVRLRGDDADLTFKSVPAGCLLPIMPSVVRKNSTTATFMIALL